MKYEIKNLLHWFDIHLWETILALTSFILAYKYYKAIHKLNQYAKERPLRVICNEGRDIGDLLYFGLYKIRSTKNFIDEKQIEIPSEAHYQALYVEKNEDIDLGEDEVTVDQDGLYVVRVAFLTGMEVVKARFSHVNINTKKVKEENTVVTNMLQLDDHAAAGICWPVGSSKSGKTLYTAWGVSHLGSKDVESNLSLQMKYRRVIKKAQAHFAMNEKDFVPYQYKRAL